MAARLHGDVVNKPDLDAFRRHLEHYILDEARRRGIVRIALHVDVEPLPDDKGGLDIIALVLDFSGEERSKVAHSIDSHLASKKGKN